MKKIIIVLLMIGFSFVDALTVKSQNLTSENLEFTVYYNWGFVWINGGNLTLSSMPAHFKGSPVLKLDGIGKSSPKWSWLFELEDHYTSWCRADDYLPLKSIKNTMEGGYFIRNQYLFDYQDSLVYIKSEESRKPLSFDTVKIERKLFDAQSATSYLRFLNYDAFASGDTILIAILMDGKIQNQKIVYKGKEVLKDKKKNRYTTYRFAAVVDDHNLFSSSDAINVWVSADEKRIPLFIKASLTIGAVKVFYNGIRFERVK